MDIYTTTKQATELHKAGDTDGAIELLKSINPLMAQQGDFNGLLKIIPYFQKAGRYSEGVEYAEHQLIPLISLACKVCFSQRSEQTIESFRLRQTAELYAKLSLIAKREKVPSDLSRFTDLENSLRQQADSMYQVGSDIDFDNEKELMSQLWGNDISSWPEAVAKRYR
jgi:hypothetical protein